MEYYLYLVVLGVLNLKKLNVIFGGATCLIIVGDTCQIIGRAIIYV